MSVQVKVAWSRQAYNAYEENGWAAALKNGETTIEKFGTVQEAQAYARGIDDGAGWDCPYWEIYIKNEISVDVRSDKCCYVTIGDWTVCLDNSTGERIVSSFNTTP